MDIVPEIVDGLASLLFPVSGTSAQKSGRNATASPNLGLSYANDLALSAPAANGLFSRNPRPRMRTTSSDCLVTHREYVQDIWVQGNDAFDIVFDQPINPGNSTMFPWLSAIANNYETYRFERLDFIFEPQSSTGNGGTIMMVVDYDAVDLPPVSKTAFMNNKDAVQSPPWFSCVFRCAPRDLHKYPQYYNTQSSTTPLSTDEKTYFVGNAYLAATTSGDPFIAGSLYIEYTVKFFTPQVNNITPNASMVEYFHTTGDLGTGFVQDVKAGTLEIAYDMQTLFQEQVPPEVIPMEVVIARPGAYQLTLVVYPAAGIITLNTENPPSGFFQTSVVGNVNYYDPAVGETMIIATIINLKSPIWFTITHSVPALATGPVTDGYFYVTPLDQNSLEALIPLADIPPLLNNSRMDKLKRRVARTGLKEAIIPRRRFPPGPTFKGAVE